MCLWYRFSNLYKIKEILKTRSVWPNQSHKICEWVRLTFALNHVKLFQSYSNYFWMSTSVIAKDFQTRLVIMCFERQKFCTKYEKFENSRTENCAPANDMIPHNSTPAALILQRMELKGHLPKATYINETNMFITMSKRFTTATFTMNRWNLKLRSLLLDTIVPSWNIFTNFLELWNSLTTVHTFTAFLKRVLF